MLPTSPSVGSHRTPGDQVGTHAANHRQVHHMMHVAPTVNNCDLDLAQSDHALRWSATAPEEHSMSCRHEIAGSQAQQVHHVGRFGTTSGIATPLCAQN